MRYVRDTRVKRETRVLSESYGGEGRVVRDTARSSSKLQLT